MSRRVGGVFGVTPRAVAAANWVAWGGLAALVACSESPVTAPRAPSAPVASGAAAFGKGTGSAGTAVDTSVTTFTYDPAKTLSVNFGGANKVVLPAGAVCDPATAGYGVGTWDLPCVPLRARLTFTVKTWADSAGAPRSVFAPDVRFVPGKVVNLYFQNPNASKENVPAIAWCTASMTGCVDEAEGDSLLVTKYDARPRLVYRRIKHFSGFNSNFGRAGAGRLAAAGE